MKKLTFVLAISTILLGTLASTTQVIAETKQDAENQGATIFTQPIIEEGASESTVLSPITKVSNNQS
ncbi:hypothetical protein SOQ11_002417 [Enterococcus faecalis]|nr:hypothetical protein [Enterococcus faecalis]